MSRKVRETMYCDNTSLWPDLRPPCDGDSCMKVRLFDDARCAPPMRECQRVNIDNPCRPGERAEVILGLDDAGNLVVCVHRVNDRPPRPQCPPCPAPWPGPCRPEHRRRMPCRWSEPPCPCRCR